MVVSSNMRNHVMWKPCLLILVFPFFVFFFVERVLCHGREQEFHESREKVGENTRAKQERKKHGQRERERCEF